MEAPKVKEVGDIPKLEIDERLMTMFDDTTSVSEPQHTVPYMHCIISLMSKYTFI